MTVIHARFNRFAYALCNGNFYSDNVLRRLIGLILPVLGAFVAVEGAQAALGGNSLRDLLRFDIPTTAGNWQVQVEQRVIVRIPRQRSTPASTGPSTTSSKPIKYKEKKAGKCLNMDRLIASRPGPKESLELATRDGTIVRAYLGDGCLAREFYAGAYIERPADGKLCVDRDLVHARTGAKCEIDKFRLLVPNRSANATFLTLLLCFAKAQRTTNLHEV